MYVMLAKPKNVQSSNHTVVNWDGCSRKATRHQIMGFCVGFSRYRLCGYCRPAVETLRHSDR